MITPCLAICQIDRQADKCIGCHRTTEEVLNWKNFTDEQRQSVMRRLGYGVKRKGREATYQERVRRYDRG
jgi:predicted Fe-S protein YdhL (DUF1289 family)